VRRKASDRRFAAYQARIASRMGAGKPCGLLTDPRIVAVKTAITAG
jgi:hypothetical protein